MSDSSPALEGELLAVEFDSVFVLTESGDVVAEPLSDVGRAVLAYYAPGKTGLVLWSMLGALSTISNGFYLIFTFPAWLIAGIAATRSQSRAPLYWIEDSQDWAAAKMLARFPTGLPRELPRKLTPKPGG
jgi:hypothetical protein